MKILVFGSLNIDHTYRLPHLVREGETIESSLYMRSEGGKGLNQAIALAKAGRDVYFAGAIGEDGIFLKDFLSLHGVNTDDIVTLPVPTGHAIIQVDDAGYNAILVFGGANQAISKEKIAQTMQHFDEGDFVLLQNEINNLDYIMTEAARRGIKIILNPSPIAPSLLKAPLELVDLFILNEIEGQALSGQTVPELMLECLRVRFPNCSIVLTLGSSGAIYADKDRCIRQPAVSTQVVDTTAAGDTFMGYFLHRYLTDQDVERALLEASCAASIAVSRPGAGQSIPNSNEVAHLCRYSN